MFAGVQKNIWGRLYVERMRGLVTVNTSQESIKKINLAMPQLSIKQFKV